MAEKERTPVRGMPNNVDAEQAVLGSILIDNKAADMLIPTLKEDDFYLATNRIIFAVMRDLQEASKPIDTVSVADELELRGKLDEVGSVDYLAALSQSVPSAAGGDHYADIIKRDALIRRVIGAGNNIARYGYECNSGTDALLNAEREIYSISEEVSEKALVRADAALGVAMKNIQDVQSGNVPKNTIFTDFPTLDKMTRGLKPGEMVLIAARPSVGKTAFALNIAANACLNHNKTVAVFSLEMPDHLLVKRMLAYVSKVSLSKMDMRGGLSSSADTGKLFDAYRKLSETQLYIDDYSMNGPTDVLSKCRRLKRETGLDLIIIDYLQLMTNGGKGREESRQLEVSDMSRRMKIYAKELDVPIILLSQMSRGVEQRIDHTPKLSDLRESGAIEQDADMVMFLHKESQFNPAVPENVVKLIIQKNRNGPIGTIDMEWDGETTSFRECVDGTYTPSAPSAQPSPDYGVRGRDEEFDYEKSKFSAGGANGDVSAADGVRAAQTAFAEDDAFTEESDDGLMPFGAAADDEPPFDTEDVPVTDGDVPPADEDGEAVCETEEEEYADSEYEDEYVDDGDEPDDGELPF